MRNSRKKPGSGRRPPTSLPGSSPRRIQSERGEMRNLRRMLIRFAGLFGKQRQERELAEELEAHFAMHVEENLTRGMNPAQAQREARLKFGGIDSAKEAMGEGSSVMTLQIMGRDLRYAVRGWRRNPGFAATAILSLALGIG